MTVVVALKTEEGVYMCADRMVSNGYTFSLMSTDKIIQKDDIIVGVCGSVRALDVVHYQWEAPERSIKDTRSDREYIVQDVVESLRNVMHNLQSTVSGVSEFIGELLIAYRGEIYVIGCDFSTVHTEDKAVCVGSGAEIASGYMDAILDMLESEFKGSKNIPEIMQLAVQSVGGRCSSVGGVGNVFFLPNKGYEDYISKVGEEIVE